jgi:hypothetical protein
MNLSGQMNSGEQPVQPQLSVAGVIAARPEEVGGKWLGIIGILVIGYLSFSRTFAYIGIPPAKLFISEVCLVLFLLWGPRVGSKSWLEITRKLPCLRSLRLWYALFLAYGVFQVMRGIASGYPPLLALRDLAFNYYPLYFLLGLWAGIKRPDLLPRILRGFAWFNGIYGVFFILFLNRLDWFVPGVSNEVAPVAIFGQPIYSFVALLGLLAFERNLRSVLHLLMLNFFVLLGMQIRGEWLAFAVGLLLWGWLSKRLKQLAVAGTYLMLLVVLMYAIDLKLPGPETRHAGTISVRDLVGRSLAPISSDLASEYTADFQDAENTAVWRTIWWMQIWVSVHESPKRALFGFGYGYPLGDLVPYLEGEFIRTPHNAFLYTLGYSGWLGVAFFFAFQAELARLLWRTWKETGQPFGILFWGTSLVFASFTAFLETPYGAIPFYLIIGCAITSLGHSRDKTSSPAKLLPADSETPV